MNNAEKLYPPSFKNAGEAVWQWKTHNAPAKPSRRSSWIQFCVMIVVGVFFVFFAHYKTAGLVLGISMLLLAGLLFSEKILHGFESVGKGLSFSIGTAVTWLLLAPVFYVVFVIVHLILKLRRTDPLHRSISAGAASYWTHPTSMTHIDRARKQY